MKSKIEVGDRVTYKAIDGIHTSLVSDDGDIDNLLEDIKKNNVEILKIERPKYEVIEEKKELLDKREKEYLWNIIKPFKDKVKYIVKNSYDSREEFIIIDMNGEDETDITLPNFKKYTMYKGMKTNRFYTLKELGLED